MAAGKIMCLPSRRANATIASVTLTISKAD